MGKHENIHFSPFIVQNSKKTPIVYGNVFFSCFFFPYKNSLNKHEKMRKYHSLLSKKESLKPHGEVMIVDSQPKGLRQKIICNDLTFWEFDKTEDRLRDMNHLETLNIAGLWPYKKDVIDNVKMENFFFQSRILLKGKLTTTVSHQDSLRVLS